MFPVKIDMVKIREMTDMIVKGEVIQDAIFSLVLISSSFELRTKAI